MKKESSSSLQCGKRVILAGFSETEHTYLHKDGRYLHLTDENNLGKNKAGGKVSKSIFFSKKKQEQLLMPFFILKVIFY